MKLSDILQANKNFESDSQLPTDTINQKTCWKEDHSVKIPWTDFNNVALKKVKMKLSKFNYDTKAKNVIRKHNQKKQKKPLETEPDIMQVTTNFNTTAIQSHDSNTMPRINNSDHSRERSPILSLKSSVRQLRGSQQYFVPLQETSSHDLSLQNSSFANHTSSFPANFY